VGIEKAYVLLENPLQFGSFSNLEVLGQFPITFEFTRTTSQVRVRFKNIVLISFDCDSCFHDDVPVVNSKIIKRSGLRSRSIDHGRHSSYDLKPAFQRYDIS